ISMSVPCVFAFDKGLSELRRPNVRGIMMAKKKDITKLDAGELGVTVSESEVKLISHASPPEKAPGQKFEGASSIPTVVTKLRDEANVI
ncbi:MAG: electron transfer flavoprotein subunit beta, partial [Candidatus Poseidoniales archaeon]